MPEQRSIVSQAVTEFLIHCADSPAIWERLEAFLQNLRDDPQWTPDEIDEVQAQIVEKVIV